MSFIWIVWSTLYVYLWITPKSEPKYVYFHQKLSIKLILDISNVRNQIFFSNVLWLHFCYWTSILLHLKAILSFKRLQANCVLSSKIEKKVILDTYFQCRAPISYKMQQKVVSNFYLKPTLLPFWGKRGTYYIQNIDNKGVYLTYCNYG